MILFQWCKTQVICLLILFYVGINYVREGNNLKRASRGKCNRIFDALFIVAEIGVLFDGITACTVNYTEHVSVGTNLLLHACMFISYEIYAVLLFWYWVNETVGMPKFRWKRALFIIPSIILICLTIYYMPELEFIEGRYGNYSMGKAVYVCFGSILLYCILTVAVIVIKYRNIPRKKRIGLATTLLFIVIILSLQIIFPESLLSCIAAVMVILSIFLNMEDPAIKGLQHYHHEMVMGFATLVENKDDSTGGHIRRSSAYALLIAKKLSKKKEYKYIITKDYIDNLVKSAPMHDIGKVGIPDAILQKPGRLTDEEFEIMKQHPVIGGKIIRDTFGHLYNGEYENMAYQVAMHHHEKWNGKGYPGGLRLTEIPLCARIMAVADVFDAVSAKRCYRDAMPLSECYEIIEKGRGVDFDPDIVDVFLANKKEIEDIYYSSTLGIDNTIY